MMKAALSIYSEIEANETLSKIYGTNMVYSTLQTPLNEVIIYII